MEILPLQFKTLFYCGIWSENIYVSFLYSTYKSFVVLLLIWFTLSHNIQFFKTFNIDGLYLAAPYVAICAKIANFTFYSREIGNLRNKFTSKICQPMCQKEWEILEKYKRTSDMLFLGILSSTLICGIGSLMLPIVNKQLKTFTLPIDSYQPYQVSNWALFSFTYSWQVVGSIYGICFHAASDTLFYGFILLICAEYDIFCLRINQIDKENIQLSIKHFVDHHTFINDLSKNIQSFFMRTVAVTFCSSFVTLAASIFNIIQVNFNHRLNSNVSSIDIF